MKKILFLFLGVAFSACTNIDVAPTIPEQISDARTRNSGGVFKFQTDFKGFENHDEIIQACQIPNEILGTLTTVDLVEVCANYPLSCDLYFFDSPFDGIERVIYNFNGLQELLEREDNGKCLIEMIKRVYTSNTDFDILSDEEIGKLVMTNSYLELVLANDKVLSNCNVEELDEIISLSKTLYKEKQRNKYYGITSKVLTGLLCYNAMSKKRGLLDEEGMNRFKESKSFYSNEFLKYIESTLF